MSRNWFVALVVVIVGGCNVTSPTDLSSCNMTLDQLQHSNTISPDCIAEIQALLPQPSNNLTNRLFPLGVSKDATSLTLFLAGTSDTGVGFTASDFEAATVTVTTGGVTSPVAAADRALAPLSNGGSATAVSFVTDYSGSMSGGDIATASDIAGDFVKVLPTGFSGSAWVFSAKPTLKQAFTTDLTALQSAMGVDPTYLRKSTALYDAIGEAAGALGDQPAPIKRLVVFTDGLDNASKTYTRDTATTAVAKMEGITLTVGTLFSDVGALQSVAGSRGAFVYDRDLVGARTAVGVLTSALSKAVALTLSGVGSATEVTVTVAGVPLTLTIP